MLDHGAGNRILRPLRGRSCLPGSLWFPGVSAQMHRNEVGARFRQRQSRYTPGTRLPPGPAQQGICDQIPREVTFSPWTCQVYYRAPSIVLGDHLRSLSSPPSRGAGPREQPTCSCGQPRGSRYCRWLCPKCPFHTYVQGFLSLSRSRKAPALSPGLEKPHNASRGRWSPRAVPSPRWRGSECSREAEQAFCLPLIRKPRR